MHLGRMIAKVDKTLIPNVPTSLTANAVITYFHPDNLGSTMLLTNASGEEISRQDYARFGQNLTMSAGLRGHQENSAYKFTGQREDGNTGLSYYGARYYKFTGEPSDKFVRLFPKELFSEIGLDPVEAYPNWLPKFY